MAYVWTLEDCVERCDQTEGCLAASYSGNKSLSTRLQIMTLLTECTSLLPEKQRWSDERQPERVVCQINGRATSVP